MGREIVKDKHLPFEVVLKQCLGAENFVFLGGYGGLKLIHYLYK